jgi:hypothetical protein
MHNCESDHAGTATSDGGSVVESGTAGLFGRATPRWLVSQALETL